MTDAPEHGARFEILRDEDAYAVAVVEDGIVHHARVTITATTLETVWKSSPPTWIAETTLGFTKTLQKNHASDGTWPQRLVRWRSPRA